METDVKVKRMVWAYIIGGILLISLLDFIFRDFSNFYGYLYNFFVDETNRWITASLFALLGFLIINGRWRKEKFLESWREQKISFLSRLAQINERLLQFEDAVAILSQANNPASPDWRDLFYHKINTEYPNLDGFGYSVRNIEVFSNSTFINEVINVDITSLFSHNFMSLDFDFSLLSKIIDKKDNNQKSLDLISKCAFKLFRASMELRIQLLELERYIRKAEYWYSSILFLPAVIWIMKFLKPRLIAKLSEQKELLMEVAREIREFEKL